MAGQKGKIPKRRVEGSLEGGSRPQADTWKNSLKETVYGMSGTTFPDIGWH